MAARSDAGRRVPWACMVPFARARTMNSGVKFFSSARFCAASAITSWHEAQCLAYRSAPSGVAARAAPIAHKASVSLRQKCIDNPNDIKSSRLPLLLSQDALLRHPVFQAQRPTGGGKSTVHHAEAVAAFEIDMQLGGHFGLQQRLVKADAVFRRDGRIVTGLDQKRRRGIGGE